MTLQQQANRHCANSREMRWVFSVLTSTNLLISRGYLFFSKFFRSDTYVKIKPVASV